MLILSLPITLLNFFLRHRWRNLAGDPWLLVRRIGRDWSHVLGDFFGIAITNALFDTNRARSSQ